MPRKLNGFTLLEMLVVLLIISIVATVAMFALGNTINQHQVKNAAQRLSTILSEVEEQAILESNVYGLTINANGYGFEKLVQLNGKKTWQAIQFDPLLKFQHWPANTKIHLQLQQGSSLIDNAPQIIISASGDLTPFTLQLGNAKPLVLIQTKSSGKVVQTNL